MSGGGGGGGLTQDQKDYQEEKWKFDWQMLENRTNYQKAQHIAAQRNAEAIRQQKNATAMNEWVDKEKMRIFDYNNQIEAYNASVNAYEEQLDYNAVAAEIQASDNNRKYNEQLIEIGYKNEDRMMNLGFNKRDLNQKLQGATSEITSKSQGAMLEGLQKQGQVLASGQTGRSARKNLQAVLAQQGSVQAGLAAQLTQEQTGYGFALEKAELGSKFAGRQLKSSMESAKGQYDADQTTNLLQKYSADIQAESALAPTPKLPPRMSAPIDLPKPEVPPLPANLTAEQWAKLKPPEDVGGGSTSGGFMGMIMAGAQVAAAFGGSDDRFKYNLNRVGTSPSGIPKYTFKYRLDGPHGPTWTGTSAQDLLAMGRGDAVFQKEKDGFYYVDYSKLDVDMEIVTT